jgi:hypothetical protein
MQRDHRVPVTRPKSASRDLGGRTEGRHRWTRLQQVRSCRWAVDQTRRNAAYTPRMLEMVVAVVVITVAVRWPLQAHRGPRGGKFAGALRTAEATAASPKWQHGTLTLDGSGEFVFRPGGPGGMRFPKGQPVTVKYNHVSEVNGSVGWSHAWSMNPFLRVARVSTVDGGTIELAASAKSLASMRDGMV